MPGSETWPFFWPKLRTAQLKRLGDVACPELQMSFLNSKSTFVNCFPINVDEIRSNDGPWEDLGT